MNSALSRSGAHSARPWIKNTAFYWKSSTISIVFLQIFELAFCIFYQMSDESLLKGEHAPHPKKIGFKYRVVLPFIKDRMYIHLYSSCREPERSGRTYATTLKNISPLANKSFARAVGARSLRFDYFTSPVEINKIPFELAFKHDCSAQPSRYE